MAKNPKCFYPNNLFYDRDSKTIADLPLPVDLSNEINAIFSLKSRKKQRISEYMCKNIRKTKLRVLKSMARVDVLPSATKQITAEDFRTFSENCRITDMSRFQEKRIRQKINATLLEKRFPHIVDEIMKDTKLEFKRVTHCAGVNLKVKKKSPDDFTVKCYKRLGRTPNYEKFLSIKKQLKARWVLHHQFMRNYLKECVIGLPHILFQIDLHEVMSIEELQYLFSERIHLSSVILFDFHKKMTHLFEKCNKIVRKQPQKFLPACTMLLSIYVSEAIAHTIEGIVKFTTSMDVEPYLKLFVCFEASLVLKPTENEVINIFHNLVDSLVNIGKELPVMEKGHVTGYESKTISLCLTQEFLQTRKQEIVEHISKQYRPIVNYLDKLERQFHDIYSDVNYANMTRNVDILFEDGCQKIKYYERYIHNVTYIPDHEYFQIGQLDLTNYREKLYERLQMVSGQIFKNLSNQHLWEVNDICDSFELIKIRATQKPSTTEELIEIGKFIAWVRNEQLEELNQRVHASLKSLCSIITLGILDEDHMRTNSAAINWIDDIVPIIEKHSVMYEQLKFEAEEKLQRIIEDINVLITDMYPLLVMLDDMDDIRSARTYLSKITLHMTKIKEIQLQIDWINKEEVCLNFPKSNYAEFDNLKEYVYPFYHLLKLSLDVQKHVSVWEFGQFDLLDFIVADETVKKFCKELEELRKNNRKKLRQAQDENLPIRFKGTVDDPDILNWPAPLKLCGNTLKILEDFKPTLKVMQIMCNRSLRPRHWNAMSAIAGFNITPNAGTTLKKMMEYDLQDKLDEYEIISTCATKEDQLLNQLNSMKCEWDNIHFTFNTTNDNILILVDWQKISAIAEDHLMKIVSMKSSVFVKPYEKKVQEFSDALSKIDWFLNNWSIFQNEFLKFYRGTIITHLPRDQKLCFEECQMFFMKSIATLRDNPPVIRAILKINLVDYLMRLEILQKAVKDYLEVVRLKSPRLFLISNEELINLFAENYRTDIFRLIFPGVDHLIYHEERIVSLKSSYGEELILKNPVNLHLNLYELVNELELQMLISLKHRIAECYKIFRKTKIEDLLSKNYPQQILQVMARVFWTDQVEGALKLSHNIKLLIYKKKLEDNIQKKIDVIRTNSLSNLHRQIFKNLLLTDINNKFLLNNFLKNGLVIDDAHFDWQIQLRYYIEKSFCNIKMLKHSIKYSYEYLGNDDQLILTPSTEKCFVTLLNAFFHNFFGLVRGQTGKTTIVISLASSLGKFMFSFNCLSDLTTEGIIQLLKGIVIRGYWLHLKNAMQLKVEVVSVISQEFLNVQESKKSEEKYVTLGGVSYCFDSTCAILVQDIGSSLPENFKIMFRTFTVAQPDLQVIAETTLTCQGITDAKFVSKKLLHCFLLLEGMLSHQKQYNFKIRDLKRILSKFESKYSGNNYDNLLCDSLREVYESRFQDEDLQRFEATLEDMFEDSYARPDYTKEYIALEKIVSSSPLSYGEYFLKKLFDVYTSLTASRAVILLGDSYTAKTTILNLTSKLFEQRHHMKVLTSVINPKCVTGDDDSRWTDGVLLNILRQSIGETKVRSWVIFDGHMDDEWTKDLLCCLDDGRFYLSSLETLELNETVQFIFETTSLEDCSPSMVSRCLTVYFPKETLPSTSLIETWLKKCSSSLVGHRTHIETLFKWIVPPCLAEIKKTRRKFCTLNDNTVVKNFLEYFQLIFDDACLKNNKKDEDPKNILAWIHATLIQACVYGFSLFLGQDERYKFDIFLKNLLKGLNGNHPCPVDRLEVGVPIEGLLLEYCFLYKQRGTWKLWNDLLKNEKTTDCDGCIMPTVDTMRCNSLLDLHIHYGKNLLIVGPSGTGKSVAFRDCYANRLPEKFFGKAMIVCNNYFQAKQMQQLILSKLDRNKSSYGARNDKKFVYFLDDLQYCYTGKYNISSAIELLRQCLDHNAWWKFDTGKQISLQDNVSFNCSVGLENKLSQRFLRHFNIFAICEFTSDTILKIFSQKLTQTWKNAGFPGDMLNNVNNIINATLNVFTFVRKKFKPRLTRHFHLFELAGFSKIIQGCALLRKETFDSNKKIYIKLWTHEIIRVIADRFYPDEFERFTDGLWHLLIEYFPDECSENSKDYLNVFFGTDANQHHYDEIHLGNFGELCHQNLQDYNRHSKYHLDLIFFNYALQNISKLSRLFSMRNENGLLLGLTGCGRQSLIKLTSFMYKHALFQPAITRKYNWESWLSDFKDILISSGARNNKNTLLVAEEQVLEDTYLQVLDFYVRDGDVVDLFNSFEERHNILELSRLAAQGGNRNIEITPHKVFLYFNRKCRDNLHIFLSLSLNSDKLRRRIFCFPSFATRLNVILFGDWPDDALRYVSSVYLEKVDDLSETIKEKVISATITIHRFLNMMPRSFIHMNKLYVDLMKEKQKKIINKKNKFERGLSKLSYASDQILTMQRALAEYQPLLAEMTNNAIKMTEEIALETIEVEKASALVRKDEKIASEQAAIAQLLKSECESELAQAIPILEDAISALNTLKPSDITLVKSMKNPPDAIKLVMASVCVIKDVKPDRIPDPSTGRKFLDYWGPSKRILGDMNFLQTLKDFDKDHIKVEIMSKIRKEYLPHKDFKPHVVAKASSAAEGLCKWIIAMDMYDRVAKEVAPKKEKLNKAEKEYAETMEVLNEKKEEVVRIEAKLAQLNDLLNESTKKQLKLQIEVDLCNRKLNSAQRLIGGLGGERLRWTEASENLQKHYDVLSGDILLSSAIIAYLPNFHVENRKEILQKYIEYVINNGIPLSLNFKFSSILSSVVEMEHWAEFELPQDPHEQAMGWLLKMEESNNIVSTKFTFENWFKSLKMCISLGKPIMIKDTEGHIPPCLNPLIYGLKFGNTPDVYVKIDQEDIKFHESARVYITSSKPDVHFSPEIQSKLTLINFHLTSETLNEEVLKIVVEIEKPEIRKLSRELIRKNRENKAELKKLETKILNTLCESKADILEDEESILVLDESKELTRIAVEKQNETKDIANIIEDFRKNFINVSRHATGLFFCINKLRRLNKMYSFSLKWFRNIYFMSILNAGKSKDLKKRCDNICNTFTYDLYKNISKGLFERDKFIFTFWLGLEVGLSKNSITRREIDLFFNEGSTRALSTQKPEWVPSDTIWNQLSRMEIFPGIMDSFVTNAQQWELFCQQDTSEIPFKLAGLAKLILIKILKPDYLHQETVDFLSNILGQRFLRPLFCNIQEIYSESYSLAVVIFVLTPGRDVLKMLHNFASVKQVLHKFRHLSLNENTSKYANSLIEKAQIDGSWVLLQNCHLTKKWIYQLEEYLENMDFENTNENFRLFLTTDDRHEIPLDLLQNSIKVIEEEPKKLKSNLLRLYTKPPIALDDYFYGCPGRQESFSKLLFRLCFFHTTLKLRQNRLNWFVTYEFEESDLLFSLNLLQDFVNEQTCLWEKVKFLIGDGIYNAYIEEGFQKTFNSALLTYFISEENTINLPTKHNRHDYFNFILNLPEYDAPFLENELLASLTLDEIQLTTEQVLIKEHQRVLNMISDLLVTISDEISIDENLKYDAFIKREINCYNKLLQIINDSLIDLQTSFQGICGLSDEAKSFALTLIQNKVPELWLKFCYPTLLNLPKFIENLVANVSFFKNFHPLQTNFLLRAFFFPKSLLVSFKLFKLEVTTESAGLIFENLIMLNAGFDLETCQIVEVNPKYTHVILPAIRVIPFSLPFSNGYSCPVFRTQVPTRGLKFVSGTGSFITDFSFKCSRTAGFWIKEEVILTCEISS